jgi:CRP-like cAMP-binding protein
MSALRRIPAYSHFTDSQLELLAESSTQQDISAGATIFRSAGPAYDVYALESGAVRLWRPTAYGHFALRTTSPGDLLGETSYINQKPRSSNAEAITKVSLVASKVNALTAASSQDKAFNLALMWAFWRSLSGKLRLANERLASFFSQQISANDKPHLQAASGKRQKVRIDMASKRSLFQEQKLSAMEINFLSSLCKEVHFRSHESIFAENEPGDTMYVVLDGKVMISKFIPGAGEEALAFLERGAYFGEMALIDKQPRSAHASAHSEGATLLAIHRDVLEGLLDIGKVSSSRLLQIFCTMVSERLVEVDEKLVGWFILAGGNDASSSSSSSTGSGNQIPPPPI